jgi:hypothetical protein
VRWRLSLSLSLSDLLHILTFFANPVQAEATTGPGAAARAAGASTSTTHGVTQAAGRRRVHDAEGPDPRVQAMLMTSDGGAHGGS